MYFRLTIFAQVPGAKGATTFAKRIVEVLSLFREGYPVHQAATLVLIITSLYSYN